jgi:hypothetical protein
MKDFLFGCWIGLLSGLIVAPLTSSCAHAADPEPYLILGAGASHLKTTGTDDLWHQQGFANETAEHSNAWRIGVGLKITRWLSVEGDYRSLGQYSAFGLWVGDAPRVPGNYNVATGQCNGPCNPTISSYQKGATDGIGLSFVAAPDWTIAPLVRLGGFYHRSSFTSTQFWPDDPHARTARQFDHDGPTLFSDSAVGLLVGVGLNIGSVFSLEYDYYPKAGGPVSPYEDISTVMLSARMVF